MNAGDSEESWAIRLSIQLYRRLLVAYPDAFRREYGAHMAQVFGDCCREAAHADGVVGLWRYWLMAFGDLIGSALAERRRQEIHMSRALWGRLGSLAAIVGGTTAALFALFGLVNAETQLLDPASTMVHDIFRPVQFTVLEATPAVSALYLLALVGLSLQGASRAGALEWIGITTSANGTVLSFIGAGALSRLQFSQQLYIPPYYDAVVVGGQLFGMLLFAVGMIIYGIAALRHQALPRWNGAPALLGVLALLAFASYYVAWRGIPGADSAGALRLDLVAYVVMVLLAVAWIGLGVALFPRKEERAAPQAISANGSVG